MAKKPAGSLAAQPKGSGRQSWAQHRWHQDNANVYPLTHGDFNDDLDRLIADHVLTGHTPPTPLLAGDANVVTLGSCFARELRTALAAKGVPAETFWIPSGLNNTFAIRDFIGWCVTGTTDGFRYDREPGGEITEWTPEEERARYRDRLAEADAFVFTIGLAEVWQDRQTGGVFWRGVPENIFDDDRHEFRVSTVAENERNLREIVALIRQVNAAAPIVLTLSPVPLKATFRTESCITADCVSKSILRVALDELMRQRLDGVFYWPSFEIVRWVGAHRDEAAFNGSEGQSRDPARGVVDAIISAFMTAYFR